MPDEWLDEEVALTFVESQGPWPARSASSHGAFIPLDVDMYDRFAMFLCYGTTTHKVVGSEVEATGASLEAQVGVMTWPEASRLRQTASACAAA